MASVALRARAPPADRVGMSRCAKTGTRSAVMSSGMTNPRPSSAAHTFAARTSCSVARGLAPSRRSECVRVACDEGDGVVLDGRRDVDGARPRDELGHLRRGDDGGEGLERVAVSRWRSMSASDLGSG